MSTAIFKNINLVDSLPELRLTDTGSDYARLVRAQANNGLNLYNRVSAVPDFNNIIPTMVSNSSPSGLVFYSSQYSASGNDCGYCVFDKSDSTWWTASSGSAPQYVGYKFASAQTITSYKITARVSSYDRAPSNFTFQGSNTGAWAGEQVTLDTRTSQSWSAGETKFYSFTNINSYLYYRVNMTAFQGGGYGGFTELQMSADAPVVSEISLISSINSAVTGEKGIQTYGDIGGRTTIDGLTTRFNVAGVEKGQLGSTMAWTLPNTITGSTDAIQLKVKGNATQTTNPFQIVTSADANILSVGNTGIINVISGTSIRPSADGVSAINFASATGTSTWSLDTTNLRIGVGTTTPGAKQHILATTEQLRLGYDVSNYLSATIGSTGSATLALTGTTPIFTFSQGVIFSSGITIADAKDIVVNTTTGTKIGTATGQKLGFWNVTPVVQQAHIADPTSGLVTDAEARTAIASINALLATLGLTAAS
ncbi:MAG: hypothetical protein WCI95_03170 [bacterium]